MADAEKTGIVPKVISEAPELPELLDFPYAVYQELSGCRNECDCIPISEIKAYCEFYEITDPIIKSFLVKIVTGLNQEAIGYKDEKRKREELAGKLGK